MNILLVKYQKALVFLEWLCYNSSGFGERPITYPKYAREQFRLLFLDSKLKMDQKSLSVKFERDLS